MVRPGTPPESLIAALAEGQAVLVLGPGFSHGVAGVDWVAAFETMRSRVSDATGWDALSPMDRVQLFIETHGRERLEVELAGLLPSAAVLRAQVTDVHKTLLGLPCPIIVTTTWDGLVEATLDELDHPYHVIADDDDVESMLARRDGARLVVKMHGDPLAQDPVVICRDDHRAYGDRRPQTLALLHRLAAERALLLYGHSYEEPGFLRVCEEILPGGARSRATCSIMKEPNGLLGQYWARRRIESVTGNTWSELERWTEGLCREVGRRHRLRWDLETLLTDDALSEHGAVVQAAQREARAGLLQRLGTLEPFRWLGASPNPSPDASSDDPARFLPAFRVLRALAADGLSAPPQTFADAAEHLARLGQTDEARSAVDLALLGGHVPGRVMSTPLRSQLGRVLCRLGELERARPLLERALVDGDPEDEPARAAELAWLCRAVLDRVEGLRDRQRGRAARELLGRFLVTFAPQFRLVEPSAGFGDGVSNPSEDAAWRGSRYYVNSRLGRLFALASELAGQSGAVYAQQAIDLLSRAVELMPAKPEPYRVLRSLLLAPRGTRPEKARWERIVVLAPPEVRRKLESPG